VCFGWKVMKKHIFLFVLLSLSLMLCTVYFLPIQMGRAAVRIWQVPQDYSTIDAAIIAASPGDTINIAGGTFSGFLVDKSLSIVGQSGFTKINGDVSVEASNSKITGLTVSRNIAINRDYCEITFNNVSGCIGPSPSFFNHCTITDNAAAKLAIVNSNNFAARNVLGSLDLSGDGNTISANTISNSLDLMGNLNIISNNQILGDKGVFSIAGEQNQVNDNKITSRLICVEFGQDAGNNTVLNNLLESPSGDGIHIEGWGKANQIMSNTIKAAKCGIYDLYSDTIINNYVENSACGISGGIKILGNTVKHCGTGIFVGSPATILSNNLIENTVQAESYNSKSIWYENGRGNYWSDWTSPDSNNDGIVDKSYVITGSGRSLDKYPSVTPMSWSPNPTSNPQGPTPGSTYGDVTTHPSSTITSTPPSQTPSSQTPIPSTLNPNPQPGSVLPIEVLYAIVGIAVIAIIGGIATALEKRKNSGKRPRKAKQIEI
jgi:nitrous oxidase accessory protein